MPYVPAEGAFSCALQVLAPGSAAIVGPDLALGGAATYTYKFVVDGRWEFEPNLPHTTDSARNINNVLTLL